MQAANFAISDALKDYPLATHVQHFTDSDLIAINPARRKLSEIITTRSDIGFRPTSLYMLMLEAEISELLKYRATRGAVIAARSMLNSMISNIWTAFEAFATDLWIEAVNLRPMTLGANAIAAPKHSDRNKPQKPKSDKASILADAKIGTEIYRKRKFNFGRLRGIRYAYEVTFGETMYKVFRPKDTLGLELLRNLIVHKGGIVDQIFLDAVKDWGAIIPKEQEVKKPLRLNGEDVGAIVENAIQISANLLCFVDKSVGSGRVKHGRS